MTNCLCSTANLNSISRDELEVTHYSPRVVSSMRANFLIWCANQ